MILFNINSFFQLFALTYYVSEFLFLPFVYIYLLYYLLYTKFWYLTLVYLSFYIKDLNKQNQGGRYIEWFKNLKFWSYIPEYFPVKLIKTCDIPANQNYIFVTHPHGVLCFGSSGNFCSNGTKFNEKFPGLIPKLLILNSQFNFPIHRDILMALGMCSCSKESINYLLKNSKENVAVCLLVGGAIEALDSIKNKMIFTLKNRKGFIRIAIETGTSLVPVIQFGENDCYTQVVFKDESFFKKIQILFTKIIKFSPPIFYGKFFLLPFDNKINTVVGKPLTVKQIENPTNEEIEIVHKEYVQSLQKLYEEYNPIYGNKDTKLIIK